MGLSQSPKTVTNGLVFYYDQNNIKSYKGPAIQNKLTTVVATSNYTTTGAVYTSGSEYVDIPQIGRTLVTYAIPQNNYTSYSPNSSDCCPNLFRYTGTWGDGFTISPSTLYTYGIVYKVLSGYTHANYMYRYEYTANGGSYVTEAGVHSDSNRIHLGDGWYWAWGTFTTQSTTNWIQYAGSWYYRYSDKTDKLSVAKVMMVQGDYTQLHPKYWPDVNTTRSSSQSIVDTVTNNTVSALNLAYANTGNISFDGSSNYIRWNNNTALDTQTPSIEVWVKTNSLNQNGFWFEKGSVNTQYSLFQEGTAIQFRTYISGSGYTNLSTASSYLSTSAYSHVVATYSSGSRNLYVNGTLVNSDTQAGSLATNSGGMTIGEYGGGGYRFNGSIDIVRVYNRVLSQAEIQQNFNALRGKYGI